MTKLWKDPDTGKRAGWVAWLMTAAVALLVGGFFYVMTFVDHSSM